MPVLLPPGAEATSIRSSLAGRWEPSSLSLSVSANEPLLVSAGECLTSALGWWAEEIDEHHLREISQVKREKKLTAPLGKCRSEQENGSAVAHHLTLTDAEDFRGVRLHELRVRLVPKNFGFWLTVAFRLYLVISV